MVASFSHHTWSAAVQQVCPTRLTTVLVIYFSIFDLRGLPLGQSSPKGEMTYCPPRSTILQNFSPIAQTVYEICVTKVFFLFWPMGLTPGPKFTKRANDLADSEIYHPATFRRPTSTRARDIRYQNSCGHTNKQKKTNLSLIHI